MPLADLAFQITGSFEEARESDTGFVFARAVPWRAFDTPEGTARWSDLARRSGETNPFHEAWYLLAALRALDPQGKVNLLTVSAGSRLIGMLPVRRERSYFGRPLPHLAVWSHGNAFLGAPLIEQGLEADFWRAVLDWSDDSGGAAIFLHLPHIPLEGPAMRALHDLLAREGRHAALVHREERALLASDLPRDAYLQASLSAKRRKELRRQATRLGELGSLRFDRREDAADLDAWTEAFLRLEIAGWKGAAGSALASSPCTAALFRESLAGAADLGRLQRLTLYLDDRPIAMLAQFLAPPGAYSFKTAFDESYARFSPGVLLQLENLALLDRSDIAWCDSCAAADHPMIDHIWRERRAIGRLSVEIGGPLRRAMFRQVAKVEVGRHRRS